jgi:GTP cyclohydrolase I
MQEIKLQKIADLYKQIMDELGTEWNESNKDTPTRVAKSLASFHKAEYDWNATSFEFSNNVPTSPLVLEVDEIKFSCLCEHHHLPFMGVVKISYLPKNKILGISKFPRLVKYLSRRKPTTQEYFTQEIFSALTDILGHDEINIDVISNTHTCCSCRGAEANITTTTKIHNI